MPSAFGEPGENKPESDTEKTLPIPPPAGASGTQFPADTEKTVPLPLQPGQPKTQPLPRMPGGGRPDIHTEKTLVAGGTSAGGPDALPAEDTRKTVEIGRSGKTTHATGGMSSALDETQGTFMAGEGSSVDGGAGGTSVGGTVVTQPMEKMAPHRTPKPSPAPQVSAGVGPGFSAGVAPRKPAVSPKGVIVAVLAAVAIGVGAMFVLKKQDSAPVRPPPRPPAPTVGKTPGTDTTGKTPGTVGKDPVKPTPVDPIPVKPPDMGSEPAPNRPGEFEQMFSKWWKESERKGTEPATTVLLPTPEPTRIKAREDAILTEYVGLIKGELEQGHIKILPREKVKQSVPIEPVYGSNALDSFELLNGNVIEGNISEEDADYFKVNVGQATEEREILWIGKTELKPGGHKVRMARYRPVTRFTPGQVVFKSKGYVTGHILENTPTLVLVGISRDGQEDIIGYDRQVVSRVISPTGDEFPYTSEGSSATEGGFKVAAESLELAKDPPAGDFPFLFQGPNGWEMEEIERGHHLRFTLRDEEGPVATLSVMAATGVKADFLSQIKMSQFSILEQGFRELRQADLPPAGKADKPIEDILFTARTPGGVFELGMVVLRQEGATLTFSLFYPGTRQAAFQPLLKKIAASVTTR